MSPGLKEQYLGLNDMVLTEKESFAEYLKPTAGMLRINLRLLDAMRHKSPSFRHEDDDLLVDYEFLLAKVTAQIAEVASSVPIITGRMAIEETRKAMQQADDVR